MWIIGVLCLRVQTSTRKKLHNASTSGNNVRWQGNSVAGLTLPILGSPGLPLKLITIYLQPHTWEGTAPRTCPMEVVPQSYEGNHAEQAYEEDCVTPNVELSSLPMRIVYWF